MNTQAQIYAVIGMITELPQDDRIAVDKACDEIRAAVEKCGEFGVVALGLVSLEMALAVEKEQKCQT